MLNRAEIIGNLARDPEVRESSAGPVCNMTVATTERWKKDGERHERTEFHRVVVFGKLVDIIQRYTAKGSKVYLSGKLQTRKWTDKEGHDRWTTEIVMGPGAEFYMLDKKGEKPEPKQELNDDLEDLPF